jgi:hypothetical protein
MHVVAVVKLRNRLSVSEPNGFSRSAPPRRCR